jgi:hypothetical protein
VLRLAGKNLPVAGAEFTPKVKPATASVLEVTKVKTEGFVGTASIEKKSYGYRVLAPTKINSPVFALKKLPQGIRSGQATITWKMKDVDSRAATRNGFLVLSSDDDALASVFAGAWSGSNRISLFESIGAYKRDAQKRFNPGAEMICKLVLDMDARTAELTINGTTLKQAFTESVTSINYIGFGVRGAQTQFSEPKVTQN